MFDYKHVNFRIHFFKSIIISSILISGIRSDENDDEFCWNPECTKLGEEVLRNMLPTLDPCEDFYEYACGNFKNNHPLPTPNSENSMVQLAQKHLYQQLSSLLSVRVAPTENDLVKKSKRLFQSCMNLTNINNDAITTLKKKMDDVGGFPMMYSPDMYDDSISWEKVHYHFARMTGSGALMNINIYQDYRNPLFNAIYVGGRKCENISRAQKLDQPAGVFGLFNSLTDSTQILKYLIFIKNIMMLLIQATGTTATEQAVKQDIRDVFKFRYLLQWILNKGPKRRQPVYAQYTINGLQLVTPAPVGDQVSTDWIKLFKGTFSLISRADIQGTTQIISREPIYILDLVRQLSATQKRTIINHIHLYFVERHLRYMSEDILTLLHKVQEEIRHRKMEKLERWQTCVQDHSMQHVLSSLYIHWYFPFAERRKVGNLIVDIRNTMKARIRRATWLDASTKQKVLLKLNTMKNVVGSEEWYRTYGSTLQEYYEGQNVGRNYLQNILDYEQNEYRMELGYLTGETTRMSNNEYPILPNAYYQYMNTMVLNVGQMQPPFYNSKFPPVVNYPGLGTVIAHEMSHGFDTTGHRYDYSGALVNWWSTSSFAEYKKRLQCLIDQFNAYGYKELKATHPNRRVRGNFTLDENFADLLGLMVSYEAYKTKMEQPIRRSRLPALKDFDNEKVFFLMYANTFCEHVSVKAFKRRIMTDIHATARLRVNAPLSNMPEFNQAFNCPSGPLNRATKCEIW